MSDEAPKAMSAEDLRRDAANCYAAGLRQSGDLSSLAAALCERLDSLIAVKERIAVSLERIEPTTRPQTHAGKEGPR